MENNWLKDKVKRFKQNKIYKRLEQKTIKLIDRAKQNSDLADIITTASFLLILFVTYLILNRTSFLAGIGLAVAAFLRFIDDNVILQANIANKLRKFYNLILNISAESLILFSIVIYFYTLNLYASVVFSLLLLILILVSHYIALLAQSFYRIKKINILFTRLHLFWLLAVGLIIDQIILTVILAIFLEVISIYQIVERIRQSLGQLDIPAKGKKNSKKKIAKKK